MVNCLEMLFFLEVTRANGSLSMPYSSHTVPLSGKDDVKGYYERYNILLTVM